ncbi:MAG: hypothetical protein WCJ72_15655 [Chryseobacterium sp.]
MSEDKHHITTIYKWENSGISQMESVGSMVYLQPSENAGDLSKVRAELQSDFSVSPTIRNGKPALRVSGVKNPSEIIEKLGDSVNGNPQIEEIKPQEEKKNFGDMIKANSLQAAAAFAFLGDILYIAEGFIRGNNALKGVGATFAVGDAIVSAFGHPSPDKAERSLIRKIGAEMEKQGIVIPEGSAIKAEMLGKKDGFIEKVCNFMQENVMMFKAASKVIGGSLMIASDKSGSNDTKIAGMMLIGGFVSSALIQEKRIDPEKFEQANIFEKGFMKVQASPLILGGGAGVGNNLVRGAAVIKKVTSGHLSEIDKQALPVKIGTTAALLTANSLYAMSKTSGGGGKDNQIISDIYAMSAQALAAQPEEIRQEAIKQVAKNLGTIPGLTGDKTKIESEINNQIESLTHNPFYASNEIKSFTRQKSPEAAMSR